MLSRTPLHVRASLPALPLAARAARDVVRPLEPSLHPDAWGNLQLLITELVTNGVRHGAEGGAVELEATLERQTVSVRVRNRASGSGSLPRIVDQDTGVEGGLGLVLLDRLSKRWGMKPGDHVEVWFELDAEGVSGEVRRLRPR